MAVVWASGSRLALRFCSSVSNCVLFLLVVGAIVGAKSGADTELWLALATLPALLLAASNWRDRGISGDDTVEWEDTETETPMDESTPLTHAQAQAPHHAPAEARAVDKQT